MARQEQGRALLQLLGDAPSVGSRVTGRCSLFSEAPPQVVTALHQLHPHGRAQACLRVLARPASSLLHRSRPDRGEVYKHFILFCILT